MKSRVLGWSTRTTVFRLVRMGRARGLCRIRDVLTLSTFEHSPPMSANELLEAANRLLRQSTNQRVTERTLRYYVFEKLVPPPEGPPKLARYGFRHLVCLVAIKILQDLGFSLTRVREEIEPVQKEGSDEEFRRFADRVNLWLMKAQPGMRPEGLEWPHVLPTESLDPPRYWVDPRASLPSRERSFARRSGVPEDVFFEVRRLSLELEHVKEIIAGYPDEDRDELLRVIRELRRAVEDLREEVRRLREQEHAPEADPISED